MHAWLARLARLLWGLQVIDYAKVPNDKLVNLQSSDARTTDCQSTNGYSTDGQCTDSECAQRQRAESWRPDASYPPDVTRREHACAITQSVV